MNEHTPMAKALLGNPENFQQYVKDPCTWCSGSGQVADHVQDDGHDCPICKGRGWNRRMTGDLPPMMEIERQRNLSFACVTDVYRILRESDGKPAAIFAALNRILKFVRELGSHI